MRFDVKITAVIALSISTAVLAVPPSTSALELALEPSSAKTQPILKTLATQRSENILEKSDDSAAVLAVNIDKDEPEQTESEPKKLEEAKPRTVVVQAGDSLSKIADANGTTWTRLFDANESISDPNTLNVGATLTIPEADAQLPDRYSSYAASIAASRATATTTTTYTTQSYTKAPVNSSSYYVGNGMWCTDYVHSKRSDIPVYGNAGYGWISAAQAQGKSTGTTPQAGAVAVQNGHVAYVESVNSDGSYVVSEMGWNYQAGNYNKRTVQPGAFGGFIY